MKLLPQSMGNLNKEMVVAGKTANTMSSNMQSGFKKTNAILAQSTAALGSHQKSIKNAGKTLETDLIKRYQRLGKEQKAVFADYGKMSQLPAKERRLRTADKPVAMMDPVSTTQKSLDQRAENFNKASMAALGYGNAIDRLNASQDKVAASQEKNKKINSG
jgi:hypothetical protein